MQSNEWELITVVIIKGNERGDGEGGGLVNLIKISFEKLENILQNSKVVKSMQGCKPATLHCRSPGCDQKWHIQSLWLGFSSCCGSRYRILQQYNQSYPLVPPRVC